MSLDAPLPITMIIAACLIAWIYVMEEQNDLMRDIRREICGGNRDILMQADEAGVVIAISVEDLSLGDEDLERRYDYKAMYELVADSNKTVVHKGTKTSLSGTAINISGSDWSLLGWTTQDVSATIGYWNSYCEDMISKETDNWWKKLITNITRDELRNYAITSCSELIHYCTRDSAIGIRVRGACAKTCRCDSPAYNETAGFLPVFRKGCPDSCQVQPLYDAAMKERECVDFDVEEPYWFGFAQGMREKLAMSLTAKLRVWVVLI